jgi:hypothetical protein
LASAEVVDTALAGTAADSTVAALAVVVAERAVGYSFVVALAVARVVDIADNLVVVAARVATPAVKVVEIVISISSRDQCE